MTRLQRVWKQVERGRFVPYMDWIQLRLKKQRTLERKMRQDGYDKDPIRMGFSLHPGGTAG